MQNWFSAASAPCTEQQHDLQHFPKQNLKHQERQKGNDSKKAKDLVNEQEDFHFQSPHLKLQRTIVPNWSRTQFATINNANLALCSCNHKQRKHTVHRISTIVQLTRECGKGVSEQINFRKILLLLTSTTAAGLLWRQSHILHMRSQPAVTNPGNWFTHFTLRIGLSCAATWIEKKPKKISKSNWSFGIFFSNTPEWAFGCADPDTFPCCRTQRWTLDHPPGRRNNKR